MLAKDRRPYEGRVMNAQMTESVIQNKMVLSLPRQAETDIFLIFLLAEESERPTEKGKYE